MALAESLGIRVPAIRRVVQHDRKHYVVMDWIHGVTLDEAWTKIGWLSTVSLAFQLRTFVKAMRSRTSPTAGALATGRCHSIWMDDLFGVPPHSTPEIVNSYFTFWLQYSRSHWRTYPNPDPPHLHLLPALVRNFVFIHQDLAPRNIILDNNGKLWLIDWQFSGWYPAYFEYVGMMTFRSFRTVWGLMGRIRWHLFCWIGVGIYRKERRAMELVQMKANSDSVGRIVIPGLWNNCVGTVFNAVMIHHSESASFVKEGVQS